MKRVLAIAALAFAAMGLTACSNIDNVNRSFVIDVKEPVAVYQVKLSDGRMIECIYLEKGQAQSSTGGPSCDWSNAK